MRRDEQAGTILIGLALAATLILIAYHVGATQGRGQPLPAAPLKHGVAFRLAQERGR